MKAVLKNIEAIVILGLLGLVLFHVAASMLVLGGLFGGLLAMAFGVLSMGLAVNILFIDLEQDGICGREECH